MVTVTMMLPPGGSVPVALESVTQPSWRIASQVSGAVPGLETVRSRLAGEKGPPETPENAAPSAGVTVRGPATGSAGAGVAAPLPARRNDAASPRARIRSSDAMGPNPAA